MRLSLFPIFLFTALLQACSGESDDVRAVTAVEPPELESLHGVVLVGQSHRLGEEFDLDIELRDLSVEPPRIISSHRKGGDISGRFPFEVIYDPGMVDEDGRYDLYVVLKQGVMGETDSALLEDPFAVEGIELKVTARAAPRAPKWRPVTVSLQGVTWTLTSIDEESLSLADGQQAPTILVEPQGTAVSGFAGCNRYTGSYALNGTSLTFGENMAVTRMACAQGMELEDRFLTVLARVGSWRLDAEGQEIVLGDAAREEILRFALDDTQ